MRIIDEKEFDEIKQDGVLLVDFFATWCGPCKMLAPVLEELAQEYEGKATIVKVDVDKDEALARRFSIMSVPTMILFKNGEAIREASGFQPKPQLKAFIDSAF